MALFLEVDFFQFKYCTKSWTNKLFETIPIMIIIIPLLLIAFYFFSIRQILGISIFLKWQLVYCLAIFINDRIRITLKSIIYNPFRILKSISILHVINIFFQIIKIFQNPFMFDFVLTDIRS
jgi:hypothetical protein